MSLQENDLERMLRLAANEPAHRPEFCRVLLASTTFVFGTSKTEGGATAADATGDSSVTTLASGSKLFIQDWTKEDGSRWIPFFTSEVTLTRAARERTPYVALPTRALFEMTEGAFLVLNPGEPYSKEFLPEEVKSLLHDGLSQTSRPRVVEHATEILLGQPRERPERMISSLERLLEKHRDVAAAYLALMHDPISDIKPHLVVGLLGPGVSDDAIHEACAVAADTAPPGEIVDLIRIPEGDSGLSRYFLDESEPFYTRRTPGN